MSRAFVKEEDGSSEPLVVPRAPLPEGAANYVTPRGLAKLRAELGLLAARRAELEGAAPGEEPGRIANAADRSARVAALGAARAQLELRLASALLVDPGQAPAGEVRFGAHVRLRREDGSERSYQIVGVDEADVALGLVAWSAPLSRALTGKRAGEVASVRSPRGVEELEIVEVSYGEPLAP